MYFAQSFTTFWRMTKYEVLVQVLDRLRQEAPKEFRSYHPEATDAEGLNQARSKSFLHLFLKVKFGLLTFSERESFITEGGGDGGIDAYFIDTDARVIFFLQSKFRQTERNFEAKKIEIEELLKMDIDRILNGEMSDASGVEYNSRIKNLIRNIQKTDHIARYSYQVIILANVSNIARSKLNTLTGGFSSQVFDYARCYKELLFPLVTATYYTFDDLQIALNLSNKNAGSKISYSVSTKHAKLEITVVFVPTIEIASAMHKYRNAILQYNPRSYLEHEGQSVNSEIRRSIEGRDTNEFALFNNGITFLSDETFLNERVGQKDRAKLTLVNPQIINGGQTAYTLSQVYRDHEEPVRTDIFGEKEVLVKIITFDKNDQLPLNQKMDLIDSISRATNSQTAVSGADRRSNESTLKTIQTRCFDEGGLWLERKRGEFSDGVRELYLDSDLIVDRNIFVRAAAIADGAIANAVAKKAFVNTNFPKYAEATPEVFYRYCVAAQILRTVYTSQGEVKDRLRLIIVSQAYVALLFMSPLSSEAKPDLNLIKRTVQLVKEHWDSFRQHLESKYAPSDYWIISTRDNQRWFHLKKYLQKADVEVDVKEFFKDKELGVAKLVTEATPSSQAPQGTADTRPVLDSGEPTR